MIKALIFDLDGVVIDSADIDFKSWKMLFKDHELDLTYQDYKNFIGMKGTEIVKKYIKNADNKILLELQNKKEAYFIQLAKEHGLEPTEGLREFLDSVKNTYDIGLVTAATKMKAVNVLEMLGISNYFSVIVTSDDVDKGKPDPEGFVKAAELLSYKPKECVIFEDGVNGVRAAKNANMKCISITTTHTKEELSEADLVIDSFKNITQNTIRSLNFV